MVDLMFLSPGLALPTSWAASVSSGSLATCSFPLEELSRAREFPPMATDSSSWHSDARCSAHSSRVRIRSRLVANVGLGGQAGLGVEGIHSGRLDTGGECRPWEVPLHALGLLWLRVVLQTGEGRVPREDRQDARVSASLQDAHFGFLPSSREEGGCFV